MPEYKIMDTLLLRAPYFSFSRYAPERLREVLQMDAFRRALLLASPEFHRVASAKGFNIAQLSGKECHTLLKYYNRMCFRPTPFGVFSSFSVLNWGTGKVNLDKNNGEKLYLLPESDRRVEVVQIVRKPSVFALSPLVYRLGNEYRFIRRQVPGDDARAKFRYSIDSIVAAPLNIKLFGLLQCGVKPAETLKEFIVQETGCDSDEALAYLTFLKSEQIICEVGDMQPLITENKDPQMLNIFPETNGMSYYAALERQVEGGPAEEDRIALERAVAILQQLALCREDTQNALAEFTQAFSARFGEQKIPLLHALDPDAGIDYNGEIMGVNEGWTPAHRLFLRLWLQNSSRDEFDEIRIDSVNPEEFRNNEPQKHLPQTTSLLFRPAGDRLIIEHAGGATATALAGRFSLFSDEVLDLCRSIALREAENNPEVIFADIHFQSGPHVDNINKRRRIYDYEIALETRDTTAKGRYLQPADLYLSVSGKELILESVSLQKRVVPRLATAFNHRHNGLGLFRLLCDMQYQGIAASLGLDLEVLFPGLSYYPRVVSGRCILSLAKWVFHVKDIPHNFSDFQSFRRQHRIPCRISSGQGDQQLVFDLSEGLETRFFLQCIKGKDVVTLTEYISSGRAVLCGHREIAGQYLAFLGHDDRLYEPSRAPVKPVRHSVRRTFAPGSEWLYVKLYCTPASSTTVLLGVISPVLKKYKGLIFGWFFIRYTDPEPHIRLRLRLKGAATGILLSALENQVNTGRGAHLVRGFLADTYDRELERYGAKLIELCEQVFCAGSLLTVAGLKSCLPELPFALVTVFKMTAVFFTSVTERIDFAMRLSSMFLKEFTVTKEQQLDLDMEYRKLKPELTQMLKVLPLRGLMANLIALVKVVNINSATFNKEKRFKLLASLCHMQLNRSFARDQRREEMRVWYFAKKYFSGEVARRNKMR